jgi:hypothetical protein
MPDTASRNVLVTALLVGGVSWLTNTVVTLDRLSDNGPLMREARDKTDARNDTSVANDMKDIRDRLGRLESRDCTR